MKIRLPCQVRAVLFSVIWLVEHSSAAICGVRVTLGRCRRWRRLPAILTQHSITAHRSVGRKVRVDGGRAGEGAARGARRPEGGWAPSRRRQPRLSLSLSFSLALVLSLPLYHSRSLSQSLSLSFSSPPSPHPHLL